jgi:hypothetical protein
MEQDEVKAAISIILLALLFFPGCATDRRSKESAREPGFFERPDPDSLH